MRHYHIKFEDAQYYISDKHRFPSITDLIEYHKLNGGGLVTRLRKPPAQLLPQINSLSPVFGTADGGRGRGGRGEEEEGGGGGGGKEGRKKRRVGGRG